MRGDLDSGHGKMGVYLSRHGVRTCFFCSFVFVGFVSVAVVRVLGVCVVASFV